MADIDLASLQIGIQSTWATAVAATVKLQTVTEAEIDPGFKSKVLTARIGNLSNRRHAVRTSIRPSVKLKGWAAYEEINYFLETLVGAVTPTGAGPYVRAGAAGTSAAVTPRILTLYYGDTANEVYRCIGVVGKSFKFSGKPDSECEWEFEGLGYSVESGASLAALSDLVRTPISNQDFLSNIFVDAWGGTIGTTQVTSSFYDFALEINTNRDHRKNLVSLNAPGWLAPAWSGKLSLNMDFDTTTEAYLNAFASASAVFQRQVRLHATAGASAIMRFDFAGTAEESPKIWDNNDGYRAVKLELMHTHNTGLTNWLAYSNTSSLATL